ELWKDVEIIRTEHGVPHIRATSLRAGSYGLAWVMSEDYGPRTAMTILRVSGNMSRVYGRDSIESDFSVWYDKHRAIENYHRLDELTRDVYEGFAVGLNRYIELNPEDFPPGMPRFTGYDVAAQDVGGTSGGAIRSYRRMLEQVGRVATGTGGDDTEEQTVDNVGSNAWAFAPSRTKSGRAILLRNPHLAWNSGYYEAHLTVPGIVDFYGDFRIGGPFVVIGGFNRHLGFATTNNAQDLDELYALDADSVNPGHYIMDGASLPLRREYATVSYKNGDAFSNETREQWHTAIGPVVHRANGKIYVVKTAGEGDYRAGEQFLRMMRATSLDEWKDAMRMRARMTSNFTYADRAGNIYYVWNAALPLLPHSPGEDTVAVPARTTRQLWTRYVPYDSLPQVLNPRGGYVHNENSSPHWTNLRAPLDTNNPYPNFERPSLSLRSQHGLDLVSGTKKVSLEDVIRMKHSYRMLLADRVKPDLIAAVKATNPTGDVAAALAMIEKWDNTSEPSSRGGSLFEVWWQRYGQGFPDSLRYAKRWQASDPTRTPVGLSDKTKAAEAFAWAVTETARRYGRWDVTWGEVHRVRRGSVDVPVGGCGGALGCFRVLNFARDPDGKLSANGGDGWVLAVEFTDVPRAYSVLAYGESPDSTSRWHADQAERFAKGDLKRVAFSEKDIDAQAVVRYRPGDGALKK
ncbi:MAG TPA: penicillin acylase family protein, partial [Gemmatimonadaceae bacterium]|nr:penicillin acylase family protein [Gemmatimonadaceae bacterium]